MGISKTFHEASQNGTLDTGLGLGYMVLGLKAKTEGKTVPEIKAESKAAVRRFNELFLAKHGSLQCKKLIGVDLSTPEGHQKAVANDLFNQVCAKLVASSAEILEENF